MTTPQAEPASPWVPTDQHFGTRLAMVRQEMGWNIKEAALACGISDKSWGNWENGIRCRDRETTADKINRRTGVDYLWLLAGQPSGAAVATPPGRPVTVGAAGVDPATPRLVGRNLRLASRSDFLPGTGGFTRSVMPVFELLQGGA